MCRALSILLIAIFGLSPFAAFAQGSRSARLPACCRRRGAHHCSSMGSSMGETPADAAARIAAENFSNTATIGAPMHCPLYPGAMHATITPVFAPAPQSAAPAAAQSSERVHAVLAFSASFLSHSAHSVRGPPAAVLA